MPPASKQIRNLSPIRPAVDVYLIQQNQSGYPPCTWPYTEHMAHLRISQTLIHHLHRGKQDVWRVASQLASSEKDLVTIDRAPACIASEPKSLGFQMLPLCDKAAVTVGRRTPHV